MIRVALKGLLGRKLRAALTGVAIVLGVAMISGSFVLNDTLSRGIDRVFDDSYSSADVVVSAKRSGSSMDAAADAPAFPQAILGRIQRLPGVRLAEASIQDEARLVDAQGRPIGSAGIAAAVSPDADHGLDPLELSDGAWPRGDREIAVDKATADARHLAPGGTIGAYADGPVRRYRISGIVRFGAADSIAGVTLAVFDLRYGQSLFRKPAEIDVIRVDGEDGVTQVELTRQIRPLLPATAQVMSAADQAKADSEDAQQAMSFLKYFLLAFGGIALLVGGFVIANTLSITVAQRTRELATLRTLGASRAQLLRSVVLEAFAVGVAGSLVGLLAGLGLAAGLLPLLEATGFTLPASDLVLSPRTIVASLGGGTLIALAASLRPAVRATRIDPIAAVREGASVAEPQAGRRAAAAATVVFALAFGALGVAAFGDGAETQSRVTFLALGVVLLFAGVVMVASRVARPLAFGLGAAGARVGGAAGSLARENAARNPSRTASTAAAMMIGLALITFVAVVGHGFRSSITTAVDDLVTADYVLTGAGGTAMTVTPHAAHALAGTPGVTVSEVRTGEADLAGTAVHVAGVEPNLAGLVNLRWRAGDDGVPARLGSDRAFVTDTFADDHGLSVGSPLRLATPAGTTLDLRVAGIFDEPAVGSPLRDVTVSTRAFDAAFERPNDRLILLKVRGGASDASTAALKRALSPLPEVEVNTREEFKEGELEHLTSVLNILYALLAMSVIVSLFGVVNTLVLSTFERTRELGMLRAIGMTRRQVRRMIRHESIVTALIGATLGIAVGSFLAGVTTLALSDYGLGFAVPAGTLVAVVVVAIFAGVVAAILPARRAARLNVLHALQYE